MSGRIKKRIQERKFKSIIWRIILSVAIATIILVAAIVFELIDKASDSLADEFIDSVQNVAIEKGVAMEQYISDQKILTYSIANNAEVIQALQEYKETGEINPELQSSIASYLAAAEEQSNDLYENLFITAGSTGFADCLGNTTLHDVSDENFYVQCMDSGYFFGNNVSPVTGNPVYVIAYAVKNSSGQIIGTVNNSIDLKTMA